MTLEEMRLVDVRTVDRDSLVDVTRVHIDEGLPKEERLKEFVRQVKNPYCFHQLGMLWSRTCTAVTGYR